MYNLVDGLTFKLRAISPNVWPVGAPRLIALVASQTYMCGLEMLPSLDVSSICGFALQILLVLRR
jgi:hypothetical protein